MKATQLDIIKLSGLLLLLLPVGGVAQAKKKQPPTPTPIEQVTGHTAHLPDRQWRFALPDGVTLDDGLSEDEAVAIALWNNAQLHTDLAALGLARADLLDAGLLRNPILQIVLPLGPYRQFESLLNFPFEVFWQRRKRVAAATAELERVAVSLEQNALNLMRDVRLTYIDLWLVGQRARLAEEAVRVREQIVRLTNVRLRVGDVSDLEATAARLDESLAVEQAVRLRREVIIAQNRLRQWLGMNAETQFTLSETKVDPVVIQAALKSDPSSSPDELLKLAIASRPDLRAVAHCYAGRLTQLQARRRGRLFAASGLAGRTANFQSQSGRDCPRGCRSRACRVAVPGSAAAHRRRSARGVQSVPAGA
jgi:outer membrane protein, heavy metal efflux system